MKKNLVLYILLLSQTLLIADDIYSQLGISSPTSQSLPLLKEIKIKTFKKYKVKKNYESTMPSMFKHIKTKKLSTEIRQVGAKINYKISKTVKLDLDVTTTLNVKKLKRIDLKGQQANFKFSITL